MIGYLNGSVIVRDDPLLIIEVNSVGYRVHATSAVLSSIVDNKVKVFTYTHVREDILELYGFSKYSDLKLFEMLINVSGVGPRTAIGIFSVGTASEITRAIMDADTSFFTRVPRLGGKNAQKIIIELKNKIGGEGVLDLGDGIVSQRNELADALRSFGFSKDEINDAARNIDGSKSVEEQIKTALKYLGK
ncbi:MAG TPA: Holliday junction branch migration protein RuvA [Patescibacteria group bacterium]|nr:Holliday junction branch migration protein RuvA [Patescibacteria group bacterium]